jgi:hypothetical protein
VTADVQSVVMDLVGLGTKNHSAGEGQQQFSSQSGKALLLNAVEFGSDAVICTPS